MSAPLSALEAEILADSDPRGVDDREPWLQEDLDAHHLPMSLREGVPAMRQLARECRYMWPNPGELELLDLGVRAPALIGSSIGRDFTLYDLRIERAFNPNVYADSIRDFSRIPFRSRVVFNGWDVELQGSGPSESSTAATGLAARVLEWVKTVAAKAKMAIPDWVLSFFTRRNPNEQSQRVKGWIDNVDGQGTSFDEYAHHRFEDKFFEGIAYTFVDNHPGQFASVADRRKAGAMPQLARLKLSDFRRFLVEERDGRRRPLQISFVQPIMLTDTSNPANVKSVKVDARKLVIAGDPDAPKGSDERKVRTFVYIKNSDGDWIEIPERRGFITPDDPADGELLDIPLVPHYAIRECAYRGRSPFLETSWIQAAIWNHNSERSGLAREASLTFVTRSGVARTHDVSTERPLLSDSRSMRYFESSETGASTQIAEMQGTALLSIKTLIDELKADIKSSHHQIFAERPTGPVTATEITLEGVHASSNLEMQVVFEEHAWQKIAEIVALLAGWKKRGTVSIPHDFGLPAADLDRNDSLYMANKMSPRAYWQERVRAGGVGEEFDLEAEVAWAEDAAKREAGAGGMPVDEIET